MSAWLNLVLIVVLSLFQELIEVVFQGDGCRAEFVFVIIPSRFCAVCQKLELMLTL